MPRVIVRMYATVREIAGKSEIKVEANNLEDLLHKLSEMFGEAFVRLSKRGDMDEGIVILLNGRNLSPSDADVRFGQNDEICIFPPVSGG